MTGKENTGPWDVIVIGGGSAGLSTALTLVRARRRVLVLDAGRPRNGVSAHMHAVLGRDGGSPLQLLADGRVEIERYGGVIHRADVVGAKRTEAGFQVLTRSNEREASRRLVLATGLRDELPDVRGMKEYWGRGVAVCPYCDAWEVGDGPIAVVATGSGSPGQAQLLRQWSPQVTYFSNGRHSPTDQDRVEFRARGIEVVDVPIYRLVGDNDRVRGIELVDGARIAADAVFTAPTLVPRDSLGDALNAIRSEGPSGAVLATDPTGKTKVTGLWAVGNVANTFANVAMSIGAGAAAGGAINADLVQEDVHLAIQVFKPVAADRD